MLNLFFRKGEVGEPSDMENLLSGQFHAKNFLSQGD